MKKIIFLATFFVITSSIFAQTKHENSGWLLLANTTKFNEKWGMAIDVQFRSGDDLGYFKNFLFRPGVTYYINKNSNLTAGYLLNTTHNQITGKTLAENRIWEQYILTHKFSSIFATHRLRLEQRFIPQSVGDDVFAQRFRYFFRLIQPLQKKQETFTKGAFVALQNETFFNIQNNDKINGSLFDQNRVYLAAGYRFSKKIDVEAGYLNQFQHGRNNNTVNNVVQLALYTRF